MSVLLLTRGYHPTLELKEVAYCEGSWIGSLGTSAGGVEEMVLAAMWGNVGLKATARGTVEKVRRAAAVLTSRNAACDIMLEFVRGGVR